MKLINTSGEKCKFTSKNNIEKLREKTISKIKKNLSFDVILNISKLSKFLDREIIIYNKYIPPTVNNYNSEKITSLFVNYLEEYYEFLEAQKELLKNLSNEALPVTIENFLSDNYEKDFGTKDIDIIRRLYKDFLYELIDMICYIGTMAIVYNSNCYDYYEKRFNEDNLSLYINDSLIRSLFTASDNGIILNNDKNLLNFLFNKLESETSRIKDIHNAFELDFIALRRLYPERKWHKIKEPLDINDEYENIGSKIEELCILTDIKLINTFIILLIPYLFLKKEFCIKKEMKYNDFVMILYSEAFNMLYGKQEVTINLECNKND